MHDIDELMNNQLLEMRRGTISLAILSQLSTPKYGYSLLSALEEGGVNVDAGTLYPLLRRLEKQGVLDSTWDTSESRPRKYYVLNEKGTELYERLRAEWQNTSETLRKLVKE